MARRNVDPRVTELYNMHRRSAPAVPARTRTSSRPSSMILGPFVQPNFQDPSQHRMSRIQAGHIHPTLEDDERPLTRIELDPPSKEEEDSVVYPGAWKLASITIALCMGIFLVALDTTIVAAATPRITDHFKKLEDVGWYGSAYLLTICAFQLAFGKCYSIFSIKVVFLTAIAIFELGSLICGVAPSSNALIIGRAIAGMGCAGIFSGALIIIAYSVPLHRRPAYTGLIGAMYGVASIAGPLLGGVFTDNLSWRWCFYINLPIGAVTTVIIAFFFHAPQRETSSLTLWQKINELDLLGTFFFLPSIVCLLIGLQWGGSRYEWGSARIVVLLVFAALLAAAFIAVQIWKQEKATVPPRIIKQRSIAFGTWFSFWLGAGYFLLIYYLPIWFQAVKDVSATQSGVMNLPLIMAHVIAALLAGGLITYTGYYTPFMLISSVLVSLGTGFITTFKPDTGHSAWIGYQALFGLGSGLGMNQPLMAAQTVLPLDDVSIGTALVIFGQTLGGAIFVSAAQNVFTNTLLTNLQHSLPEINPELVLSAGATALRKVIEGQGLGKEAVARAAEAYSGALVKAFQMATGLACVTIIGAVGMEWKSVKEEGRDVSAAMG
ncbi:MAG: hypothetical protein L6R36_003009 [Xanthoria steineri]|nr:MAG: hypothetical protein L6R36_003009 [Xanthoria steineri]